jgi:hypothetical protein
LKFEAGLGLRGLKKQNGVHGVFTSRLPLKKTATPTLEKSDFKTTF